MSATPPPVIDSPDLIAGPPAEMSARSIGERVLDFPSRIDSMTVKELRQGLRSGSFTALFLVFHTAMLFAVLMGVANDEAKITQGFLIFFSVVAFFIVQPLRALVAVSSERKFQTLDLIQMAGLSTWKIIFGKWLSLASQSALVLVALLPYIILIYFIGEVEILDQILTLLSFFAGSLVMTAWGLTISTFRSALAKVIAILGTLALFFSGFVGFVAGSRLSATGAISGDFWEHLTVWIVSAFLSWYLLAFATSQISSLSENIALKKRLSILGAGVLVLISFFVIDLTTLWINIHDEIFYLVVFAFIFAAIIASVDALSESEGIYQRILEPFRSSKLKAPLAILLTRGWVSAFFFVCFLTVCCFLLLCILDEVSLGELSGYCLAALNTVLLPAIFIRLICRDRIESSAFLAIYVLIHAGIGITASIGYQMLKIFFSHSTAEKVGVVIPHTNLIVLEDNDVTVFTSLTASAITFALLLIAFLFTCRSSLTKICQAMKGPRAA